VLALVRQTRGGALYDSRFGTRQSGTGPYADMLAARFRLAIERLGLNRVGVGGQKLDCGQFRVPEAAVMAPAARRGEPAAQLALL
jgi:hypothetical protein